MSKLSDAADALALTLWLAVYAIFWVGGFVLTFLVQFVIFLTIPFRRSDD